MSVFVEAEVCRASASDCVPPKSSPRVDDLAAAYDVYRQLQDACQSKIQGRDDVIELLLIAMLSDGHVLLEDHPGSGKTTLAKALGNAIDRRDADDAFAAFRRIQFTPDLLPSDVTGTTTFDPDTHSLTYQPGPVFANVVLADEINRTSPKVQASMLEAMAEKQVTVDNKTYELEELFFVIATQNPLDQCGTYPLPRAQLDRFLFKIRMSHLSRENELAVLAMKYPQLAAGSQNASASANRIELTPSQIAAARRVIHQQVQICPSLQACLVDISVALRNDKRVAQGVSTRCLVVMIPALQARAMIHGRSHVVPDDIRALADPVFAHRLELVPGMKDPSRVIEDCMLPVLEQASKKTLWQK